VGRAEVEAELIDDSKRPHLTIIGTTDEQRRLLSALTIDLPRWRVQGYTPERWELGCGFAVLGTPTVYLQSSDGRVMLRRAGAVASAELVEALRRADPSYAPAKDPGGKMPGVNLDAVLEWAKKLPTSMYAVGGALLVAAYYLLRGSAPAPVQKLSEFDDLALQLGRAHLYQMRRDHHPDYQEKKPDA
jgi:hypothetical protein